MSSRISRWVAVLVCSEARTGVGFGSGAFAGPPPLTSRWNEISWVEEVKKKREVKAVFEVVAYLAGAIDGTPSMMEDVDDDVPMGHVSGQIEVGIDGDGIPTGSPNRMDDHAKSTTEDPLGRPEMKW